MKQIDNGPGGAQALLKKVQSGNIGAPSGASREALLSYRKAVQDNLIKLSLAGKDKTNPNFSVMEARLKIYDIWLKAGN